MSDPKIIFIFASVLLFFSCGNSQPEETGSSRNVDGINKLGVSTNPEVDFALQKGVALIAKDSGHLAFPWLKTADRRSLSAIRSSFRLR